MNEPEVIQLLERWDQMDFMEQWTRYVQLREKIAELRSKEERLKTLIKSWRKFKRNLCVKDTVLNECADELEKALIE